MKDDIGPLLGTVVGFVVFMFATGLFVLFAWPLLLLIPIAWYLLTRKSKKQP